MKTCPGGGVHTAGDRPKVQCTSCTYRGCVVCKTYWHQGFDCEGVPEEKSVDKDWLRSEREKDEEKARLRLLEEDELVTRRMEERERALDNAAPLPAKPCPGAECGIPVSNPRRAPFPTCKSLTLASTTRASPSPLRSASLHLTKTPPYYQVQPAPPNSAGTAQSTTT